MIPRRSSHFLAFAVLIVMAASASSTSFADDYFRVALLGTLQPQTPAGTFRSFRLNDAGTVIGKIPSGSFSQAASWQNGVVTPLGFYPGGLSSYGVDANASGLVVGQIIDQPGNPLAAVRINGIWDSLLYPSTGNYGYTSANGINSLGRVVGYATTRATLGGAGGRAFYHPGYDGNTRPTILGLPTGYAWSDAYEINDNNLIAGDLYFSDAAHPVAVIWNTAGSYQILGPSYNSSTYYPTSAQGINNNNISVGYANTSSTTQLAVYWDGTGIHAVVDGQGNGVTGVANSINNSNAIVGSTVQSNAPTPSDSLAWFKSPLDPTIYSLTALQTNAGLTLYTASDINASFQIVGVSSAGGYIASPVVHRIGSGAWSDSSQWLWGIVPASVHPVTISATSASLSVTGPTSPATISELNIGSASTSVTSSLQLASGQSLTVTANSFGSGVTTVLSSGSISVDGNLSSPIQLGGTLAGAGTVNGTVTVLAGGTISPGHSPGNLTINGSVGFKTGSRFIAEINGTTAGSLYDQLTVSGLVDFGGASLLLSGSYTPAVGESFTLINCTGTAAVTGTFAGLSEGSIVYLNGRPLQITYAGGTGNDVVVTGLSAIQAWRQQVFGTIANAGSAANLADPDGDGLCNLLEFAFGTNPLQGFPGPLQYAGTFAGGGTIVQTGQPTVRTENSAGVLERRGLFVRRKDYNSAGLAYVPQFSADLGVWQNSGDAPTVLADDGVNQIVSVPFPSSLSSGGFFRVQVTVTQ